MEWQTKEYIDERLDTLEDKLDTIIEHFKIEQDNDNDSDEDLNEDSEETDSELEI